MVNNRHSLKGTTIRIGPKFVLFFMGAVFVIILLVTFLSSGVDWQAEKDAKLAREFEPSEQIIRLVEDIRLTARGKNVLYASSPQIKNKEAFNFYCGEDNDPYSFVLGCYYKIEEEEYIDIYNSGASATVLQSSYYSYDYQKEVTLSHEMLHAVYEERLSQSEIADIDEALENVYSTNADLKLELSQYPKEQKYTELFARVGTEVETIPATLSKVYDRYFEDRVSLVRKFKSNYEQIKKMEQDLKLIEAKMDEQMATINSSRNWYTIRSAIAEYNRLVGVYNQYSDIFINASRDQLDSEK